MISVIEHFRPVSNFVLLPCKAGSTLARLQHNTNTTWFQTSNLIQSNRTAVTENKNHTKRSGLVNFYMYSNVFIIYLIIEFGTAVARRLKRTLVGKMEH